MPTLPTDPIVSTHTPELSPSLPMMEEDHTISTVLDEWLSTLQVNLFKSYITQMLYMEAKMLTTSRFGVIYAHLVHFCMLA